MDPFNQFLRQKISNFKRRTNADLLFTEITKSEPMPTRELAKLVANPLNQSQRKKMSQAQIDQEDERLKERADFLSYQKTVDEVMNLFSV